jgi:hypothetical protein
MAEKTHNEQLLDFLQEVSGTRDVLSIEYNAIDETTPIERLDLFHVRGSIRLVDPCRVVMPKEANDMLDAYIASPLP